MRSSLRYKIGAWMLVLSLIPLGIISAVVLSAIFSQLGAFSSRLGETEESLRSDVVGRNLAGAAGEAATLIDGYLVDRIRDIRLWAENPSVLEAARLGTKSAVANELTGTTLEQAQERLQVGMMVPIADSVFLPALEFLGEQVERPRSPFIEIVVTENTGLNVLITRPVEAIGHAADGWWQAAGGHGPGGIGMVIPHVDLQQQVPVMGIALPIIDPDTKEHLGVVRALLRLGQLQERISRLGQSLGADVRAFTSDGSLVADTASGHSAGLVLTEAGNLIQQDDTAAGRALAAVEGTGFLLADAPSGRQIVGYARTSGNAYYSLEAQLPEFQGLSWGITVSQPEQVAIGVLRKLIDAAQDFEGLPGLLGGVFSLVSLAFAGLALGGSILVSGSITRPVLAVSQAAQRVQQGDLTATVEARTVDEVGKLSEAFNAMTAGLRERERERDIFGRVVTPEIREHLLTGRLELGGETRDVTVLFSDIRGFSTIAEGMTAHEVVTFLNEYLTEMTSAVREYGGYLNNFIGDAVVAIFGAPTDQLDKEHRAVLAALEMRERLAALNRRRVERGDAPILSGIGISTGKAVAGQVGSLERLMYTVIGDSVNIAARLEALTKEYPDYPILINGATARGLEPGTADLHRVGPLEVKGRAEPVEVYAVVP